MTGSARSPAVDACAFAAPAADGFPVRGHWWPAAGDGDGSAPVVVVSAATSVRARYYHRFAAFLAEQGFEAVTYDYRGIGDSRPPRLRGLHAGWADWGRLDLEAVLQWVLRERPGRALHAVGHSIGGFVIGLAPSARHFRRVFTMGAQFAYWRDYQARRRIPMWLRWHLLMPALTRPFGYFPGRRLGWLEDTPAGVVRDWSGMGPGFEHHLAAADGTRGPELAAAFARVTAPLLAVSTRDDPFGTVAAIERLLAYYRGSPRQHLRIAPADIGVAEIGHFAFFHDRFRDSLWPLVAAWLAGQPLPADTPGECVSRWPAEDNGFP